MKFKRFIVILLGLICLFVISLSISLSTARAAPLAVIHKSGALSSSETWTADNLYWVDGNLTIPAGVTLTIDPGVIVKFSDRILLIVNGTLHAVGSAGNQIYLTSIRDDAVGGDTNGDGSASSPGIGDWSGITDSSGSSVILDYLTLRYSGWNGSPTLYAGGYVIPNVGDHVVLDSNLLNGIWIPGGSISVSSLDFPFYPAAAYYISGNLTIPSGVIVTVEPGAILKFADRVSLSVSGVFQAVGTVDHQIYLTSIHDDAVGGDTNSDGSASSPGVGNWIGIADGTGGVITLDYLTLRYSGWNGNATLYAGGYDIPQVGDHVVLSNNYLDGIWIPNGSVSVSNLTMPYYPAAAYFISGDLTIPDGTTVTVAPGAILKFQYRASLTVNGTFHAVGTKDNRIYLTSISDDAVGGDTNGDETSSSPGVGNWIGVADSTGGVVTLDYLTLRYSGWNGNATLYAGGYVIPQVGDNVVLSNNYLDGIWIPAGSISVSTLTMPYYPAAAYFIPNGLIIPSGSTLIIAPGAVLKFTDRVGITVNGALQAVGNAGHPIYFTSIRDDAVGGDTNGDGSASSPGPGSWLSVVVGNGSAVTLDYVTVRYGGWNGNPALYVSGGTISLSNSTLTRNYIGLEANIDGVAIHHSNITQNTGYGVKNDLAGSWLDATGNWWGDVSGPKDTGTADGSNNPFGLGDPVTDWVKYNPWMSPTSLNNNIYLPMMVH